MMLLEYQNINVSLQKAMFYTGMKEFLLLQKLKIQCGGHMLLLILRGEEIVGILRKKIAKNKSKRV